ncbi:MAG: hypothetical protein ACPGZQ_06645 [Flavobacteriaceae bacterium]
MKTLSLIIALFAVTHIYAQTAYGYVSRYDTRSDDILYCDDLVDYIVGDGRYLDVSFGNYRSTAVEKIQWYEYNDYLVCLVYFKFSNRSGYRWNKGYIYGGWDYDFDVYYEIKTAFENAESSGEFFWEYIEPAKVDCE